jgi:hypothetical protein
MELLKKLPLPRFLRYFLLGGVAGICLAYGGYYFIANFPSLYFLIFLLYPLMGVFTITKFFLPASYTLVGVSFISGGLIAGLIGELRYRKLSKLRITLVVIGIYLVSGLGFIAQYSVIDHIACVVEGGSYQKSYIPGVGRTCVHTYSDGGKSCVSSDDCEGRCLITKDTVVVTPTPERGVHGLPVPSLLDNEVIGGTGECEYNNAPKGCFPGTIEFPVPYCT